jgi:hypothetical protein
MSLVLGVEILGEFKNLTAATKGAQTQLGKLNDRASKISAGMNKAFAAIGIGFSLRVITQQLEEAAKAAIDDAKSMDQLALAMENTAGATKAQIAQAEKSINRMQFQAGVADDKLRPAFQKLFFSTKDVTESNRLLQIALDASASTGKDLDVITQAMARSLGGSDTALLRLIPSLKGAADPMAELERLTKGAAEAAANTDPYQRMQIIFGELQEQIGMALLPLLQDLSTWLATPEGQAKLQEIVDGIKGIITEGVKLVKWAFDNKDWLVPIVTAIGTATAAWKIYITTIGLVAAAEKIFTGTSIANAGAVGAAWSAANLLKLGAIGGVAGLVLSVPGSAMQQPPNSPGQPLSTPNSPAFGKAPVKKPTIYAPIVNVKPTLSADQIAREMNKKVTSSGTSVISSLTFGRQL